MYQEVTGQFKVRYHRQDKSNGCGWACAQMVVNSVNDPPDEVSMQAVLDQDLIFGNWNTEPMRLANTLTTREKLNKNFDCISCKNEVAISRRVVATIFQKNVAPSVLVWDENHWVVVYACDVSAAPKIINDELDPLNGEYDPFDQGYTIEAFYIHDPSPGPPFGSSFEERDVVHDDNDLCGTGGIFGRSHIWIDYAHWQEYWLTGVDTVLHPNWRGNYITIANAEVDSSCPPPPGNDPRPPGRGPGSSEPTVVELEKAKRAAEAELFAKLLNRPDVPFPWDRLLPNPPNATWAKLVGPGTTGVIGLYFYLVEITAPDGSVPVAVMIDADTFEMLATAAIPKPVPIVPLTARAVGFNNLEAEQVDQALKPGTNALGRVKLEETTSKMVGRNFLVNGKEITIEEDPAERTLLVWEHNLHSMSPFAPYYKIPVDTDYIYVRLDDPSLAQKLSSPLTEVIDLSGYSGLYTKTDNRKQVRQRGQG